MLIHLLSESLHLFSGLRFGIRYLRSTFPVVLFIVPGKRLKIVVLLYPGGLPTR